jgi:hypothetical protein
MADRQADTPEAVPEFYIDRIQYNISPYTYTFRCGLQREGRQQPQIVVVLHMSPQHAKALHQTLGGALEHYERVIGPIPLPPIGEVQPEQEQED